MSVNEIATIVTFITTIVTFVAVTINLGLTIYNIEKYGK